MKNALVTLAGLAMAGAAFAQVDTTRPMVTGHGNVGAHPQRVVVTNQTATGANDQTLTLEKFVVTGSLIQKPANTAKGK
jgi:hypothetical protein